MGFPSRENQFKPGQSGNPGGRPKGSGIRARLREILDKRLGDTDDDLRSKLILSVLLNAIKHGDPRDLALLAELEDQAGNVAGDQVEDQRPRIVIPAFDERLGDLDDDDDDGGDDGEGETGTDG